MRLVQRVSFLVSIGIITFRIATLHKEMKRRERSSRLEAPFEDDMQKRLRPHQHCCCIHGSSMQSCIDAFPLETAAAMAALMFTLMGGYATLTTKEPLSTPQPDDSRGMPHWANSSCPLESTYCAEDRRLACACICCFYCRYRWATSASSIDWATHTFVLIYSR
jgi:hypothetical protein